MAKQDVKILRAIEVCNAVESLDLNNDNNMPAYKEIRYEMLSMLEEKRYFSYEDSKGYKTVGVGFCMDLDGKLKAGRDEWDAAFISLEKDDRPSFDDVYNGKKMTEAHVRILFNHSMEERSKIVRKLI